MNAVADAPGLWRLVYWSRNLVAGDTGARAAEDELSGILAAARRNNPRYGVTGALLFNRGAFAQVLEGPRDGVVEIFERIQCDPRHTDVVILEYAPAPQRRFAEWSMAYLGADKAEAVLPPEFADRGRGLAERLKSEQLLSTIRTMLEEPERV